MGSVVVSNSLPVAEGAEKNPWLARLLARKVTLTWEALLILALAALSLVSRLWALGARVMSHDESLHVFYSWQLATGKGFFHDPMMHGPLLFEATAMLDTLFGANDFTSRLLPALLGIFLVVGLPRLLKPWLGRAGALAASALLLISPFVSYFSRYIRHDIPVITWTMLAILAIFRYLDTRRERDLLFLAAAVALMISTMEIAFIYLALFAGFLLLRAVGKYRLSWRLLRESAEYDLLITLSTLGAFFSSPIALLLLNPLWRKLTATPFVDLTALDVRGVAWSTSPAGPRLWGLFAVFSLAAVVVGLRWNWRRWWKLAVVFAGITIPLFTTFFTNLAGVGTGFIGSLGYWLSQQGVERGSQPWYYYLIVFPLYEYLPLIGGLLGATGFLLRRKFLAEPQRSFVGFLVWWSAGILVGLSLAGEKMPWLSTHIAIPFLLLAAWWIGQLVERGLDPGQGLRPVLRRIANAAGLALVAILMLMTVHTSLAVNYVNYDYSTEWIDYAHGAPGVKWALNDIAEIANHTGEGPAMRIAFDDEVAWPMSWYLRDYPNQVFFGDQPNRQALAAPVILAGPKNWAGVEAILGNEYHRFQLTRLWWPLEDYRDLTWDRVRNAASDPAMRRALWAIFWDRDFRQYAVLTGQDLNPPANWPLAEPMRVYVRRDIATRMLSLSLGPTMMEDLPTSVDAYQGVHRSVPALRVIGDGLLNAPRGLAIGQDGSIYVADTANSRILRLDPDGNILATWGSRTPDGQIPPAPGTFLEPWGVAVDPQGNVYVADTWNQRIQKFDPLGNFLLEWGNAGQPDGGPYGFWGPRGIAVGRDGSVYVTDTGNKRVVVFDENGNFLLEFGNEGEGQLDEPVGIALGPDDQVYVADTWKSRVVVFSQEGEYRNAWPVQAWEGTSLDNKPYLAVDQVGRVYITDPDGFRVIVFSASGEPLAAFGQYGPEADSFRLPVGLAGGSDDTLWVVDSGSNRIGQYAVWP